MSVTWQEPPLEPYATTPAEPQSVLDRQAAAFHAKNPHVMRKLVQIAREVRGAGHERVGIALLFERLRWIAQMETQGDRYRLNNNHRAWFARQLMANHPELAGLFATRDGAHDPAYHSKAVSTAARVLRSARRARPRPSSPTPAAPTRPGLLF